MVSALGLVQWGDVATRDASRVGKVGGSRTAGVSRSCLLERAERFRTISTSSRLEPQGGAPARNCADWLAARQAAAGRRPPKSDIVHHDRGRASPFPRGSDLPMAPHLKREGQVFGHRHVAANSASSGTPSRCPRLCGGMLFDRQTVERECPPCVAVSKARQHHQAGGLSLTRTGPEEASGISPLPIWRFRILHDERFDHHNFSGRGFGKKRTNPSLPCLRANPHSLLWCPDVRERTFPPF